MNQGNINFRMAVEEMKSAYVSTPSRKAKKRIVRKTVKAIKAKNGRFLSKLRKSEIKMLGLPHKVVFEVVADNVAIEKTKQAIRYIHYKKDAGQDGKSQDLKAKKVGQSADKSIKKSGTSALSSSDDSDQSTSSERHRSNRNLRLPEVNGAWAPASVALPPMDPSAKNLFNAQKFSPQHVTTNLNPLAYSLASPFLTSHSPTLRGIQMPSPALRGTPMGNPGLQDLPSQAIPGILPSLHTGGPSFLPARDFNALRAGAQASHFPESASTAPAGRPRSQSQSMMIPPPSQQEVLITDFLRRHMIAGGPPQGGLTSEQMTADDTIRASLQLGQQLQQASAFQDDRLRAAPLADEQRRFLNSYLSFPPR
jgi:hypothetical protein